MTTTTIIILLATAILLLIVLVGWLILCNQRQHEELQDKNKVIVREIQRRFALESSTNE